MWLHSPLINCTHGFSDRHGGVSPPPFDTLNLGGHEDDPENIRSNRGRALDELGLSENDLCLLKQVHGVTVQTAERQRREGDALVTNEKGLILAVSVADCYPILFHDARNGVIAAAHAGWRGTCGGIATATVNKMIASGAEPGEIMVAVGQGISVKHFEVGSEVTEKFREAGFPDAYLRGRHIDLAGCLVHALTMSGIRKENIWHMNRCTFEPDFFSHRRDEGRTGRMWGLICMKL
jgi:polyphenol oxidase